MLHRDTATCRRQAETSLRADWPSGKERTPFERFMFRLDPAKESHRGKLKIPAIHESLGRHTGSIENDIKLTHVRTTVFDFGFVQTTYSVKVKSITKRFQPDGKKRGWSAPFGNHIYNEVPDGS